MITELHHKISSELSNSEDLLTGTFFGTLRYTNLSVTLPHILKKCHFKLDYHRLMLIAASKEVRNNIDPFKFWPIYKNDEIDLIIELQEYVIGIEIKYHSGLSSDDEMSLDQFDSEKISTHQLARYSKMLVDKYPNHHKILIFLAKESKAISVYEDALNRNLINCEKVSFGFLTWQDVFEATFELNEIVKAKDRLIMDDLSKYLIKKGFDRFKNFNLLTSIEVTNKKYFSFNYTEKFEFLETKKIRGIYYEFN